MTTLSRNAQVSRPTVHDLTISIEWWSPSFPRINLLMVQAFPLWLVARLITDLKITLNRLHSRWIQRLWQASDPISTYTHTAVCRSLNLIVTFRRFHSSDLPSRQYHASRRTKWHHLYWRPRWTLAFCCFFLACFCNAPPFPRPFFLFPKTWILRFLTIYTLKR